MGLNENKFKLLTKNAGVQLDTFDTTMTNSAIYVTGFINAVANTDVDFGDGVKIKSDTFTHAVKQLFVAKYTHDFKCLDAKIVKTSAGSQGFTITVNNYGIYVAGFLDSNTDVDFGDDVKIKSTTANNTKLFIAKYTHDLKCVKATSVDYGTNIESKCITSINVTNGNVYICGHINMAANTDIDFGDGVKIKSDTFTVSQTQLMIAKYTHGLKCLEARVVKTSNSSELRYLTVTNNCIYACGEIESNTDVDFGNNELLKSDTFTANKLQIVVCKYDFDLKCLKAIVVKTTNRSQLIQIKTNNYGVYICGFLTDTGTVDLGNGVKVDVDTANSNSFLAKYDFDLKCLNGLVIKTSGNSIFNSINISSAGLVVIGDFKLAVVGVVDMSGKKITLTELDQPVVAKYTFKNLKCTDVKVINTLNTSNSFEDGLLSNASLYGRIIIPKDVPITFAGKTETPVAAVNTSALVKYSI